MKKLSFLVTVLLVLLLTSCDVHFGNIHYDAPWWSVAIPILVVLLISHIYLIHRTYTCPNCGYKIKPKWYQISIWVHVGGKRIVKCPNCGKIEKCDSE